MARKCGVNPGVLRERRRHAVTETVWKTLTRIHTGKDGSVKADTQWREPLKTLECAFPGLTLAAHPGREGDHELITDTWIAAGTPIGEPYPCRCHEHPNQAYSFKCACNGRDVSDPVIDGVLPEGCCARLKGPAAGGSGEDGSRLGDYRNEKDLGLDGQSGGGQRWAPSGNVAETRKEQRAREREALANWLPKYIEEARARIWSTVCACRTPWDQTSGAHGVHCSECHTNFASGAANYLHRPMFATECKDPGDVVDVDWGNQLLGMEYRNGLPVWFVKPHRNTRRVVP